MRFTSVDNKETDADRMALSVTATIQAFIDAGANPSRLVMGVPFYGRAWIASPHSEKHGLYESAKDQIGGNEKYGNWENGYFDYWGVQKMIADGVLKSYQDGSAHAPYAYSEDTGLFVSYDSPESIQEKVEYVKSHDLGGVMFWSLDGDVHDSNSPASLLNTINKNLP